MESNSSSGATQGRGFDGSDSYDPYALDPDRDKAPDFPERSAAQGRYGRAVENGDGLLHIEKEPGVTFCGETFDAYVLHWDTRTVIGCGRCLIAAGVPVKEAG